MGSEVTSEVVPVLPDTSLQQDHRAAPGSWVNKKGLGNLWMDVCLQPMDVFKVYLGQAGNVADLVQQQDSALKELPIVGEKRNKDQNLTPVSAPMEAAGGLGQKADKPQGVGGRGQGPSWQRSFSRQLGQGYPLIRGRPAQAGIWGSQGVLAQSQTSNRAESC